MNDDPRPRIHLHLDSGQPDPFGHQVWLDPCSSPEDAAALWRAFGFEATPERTDRLHQMRHPEYLHHDNVTGQVRIINVEGAPNRLPSGHFVTGSRKHDETELHDG